MKKIIILLLALLMLTCLMFAVSAEDQAALPQYQREQKLTVAFSLPEEYANIKTGSVVFTYDDTVFELVEGKWNVPGAIITNVSSENLNGVFACSSPIAALSGEIFSLTLKVKADAEFATYDFTASFGIADADNTRTEVPTQTVSVRVVDEIDDETTPADFAAAVAAIPADVNDETTYNAICEALGLYNRLIKAEKAEAAEAYAAFTTRVEAYNTGIEVINTESDIAVRTAFAALIKAFGFLSVLIYLVTNAK